MYSPYVSYYDYVFVLGYVGYVNLLITKICDGVFIIVSKPKPGGGGSVIIIPRLITILLSCYNYNGLSANRLILCNGAVLCVNC